MKMNEENFDLITFGQSLHWFPVSEALRKCKRMLSPGGALGIYAYDIITPTSSTSPE